MHRTHAAAPNKKYDDVCFLQREGSNQRNLLFEMKTQEEHILSNILKQATLKKINPIV